MSERLQCELWRDAYAIAALGQMDISLTTIVKRSEHIFDIRENL